MGWRSPLLCCLFVSLSLAAAAVDRAATPWAVHWHGIRQVGTPWADGTEGVTQCPILPGDNFTYAFAVDRPGTYMYHAHYGVQRSAELYGVIVVAAAAAATPGGGGKDDDVEPFTYDDEHFVLLNDWWHSSTYEQAGVLASVPMVWVGEPHSLLINGRGRFNCSAAVSGTCNATSPECATPVFAVVPGKTYRFRIASVTSLSALNFEIEEWEISYQFKSPDCARKLAVTIDGQTAGPTISATQGDTVVVLVKNFLLTEYLAIHWHGIRQIGTPWADGTEGVTQCPILPGDAFVVHLLGTYMYHAHYGMQRSAGLNGLIVVAAAPGGHDAEPFRYDGEHHVLLNDWWNKSTYEQAMGLASVPLVWVREPQGLLINGRGRFVNCSAMAAGACNATHPECAAPVFAVVPGKTYRFRIASFTSLSALNFEIEDHNARLIAYAKKPINGRGRFNCSAAVPGTCNATSPECATPVFAVVPGNVVDRPGTYMHHAHYGMQRSAGLNGLIVVAAAPGGPDAEPFKYDGDGHYVKPFVVNNLNIYSGETYSVLIKADQDSNRNYWIASNVVSREPGTPTGTAVLSYYGGRSSPRRPPPTTPPAGPAWNDTNYQFQQSLATVAHPAHAEPPPPRADRTILLLNTQNKVDGRIKWALNNVSFTLPHTPYLVAMKSGLLGAFDQRPPPETYAHQRYDVYAVQRKPNATVSDGLYRLRFGSVVDVVLQNANMLAAKKSETHPWHLHSHDFWVLGYGIGRFDPAEHPKSYNLKNPILKNTVVMHPYGWTALRFRDDNPGVWPAFHCHVESHFFMGMGIVFEDVKRVAELPQQIIGCIGRFDLEDHNARLTAYAEKPINKAVASGTASSRRAPMGYLKYGVLFLLMFYAPMFLPSGNPAAEQNPTANEGTITRSGPTGSLPVGGGQSTPSPSPASASSPSTTSSTDPAYGNRSSATSSTSGGETVVNEEDRSGRGSAPQRPVVPVSDNEKGPLFTFVLALLAYDAAAMVAILHEFERIVGTWSTAPQVVYIVFTVVAIALLMVGAMAAGCHARASPMAGGNSNMLSVSDFCASLGSILFTTLFVVALFSKSARWARVAAVPSATVIACIMAAVWIWGDEHAVANAVVSTWWGRILGQHREREPAGDDMV